MSTHRSSGRTVRHAGNETKASTKAKVKEEEGKEMNKEKKDKDGVGKKAAELMDVPKDPSNDLIGK